MLRSILLLLPIFAVACLADPIDTEIAPLSGEDVYRQPVIDGNTFTCATCHALSEPSQDGLRRPGHALGGAPSRASYKNGQLPALVDAVNSCLNEWMGASSWTDDDPRFVALQGFLADEATPEGMQELNFDIVLPPAQTDGGDAVRGQTLFNESCVVCHGTDAVGTNKAPGLAGLGLDADYIARRVRTSGLANSPVYVGLTGGRMPFWSADRVSDDELRDLIAFVSNSTAAATPTPTPTPMPMGRTCDSSHGRVGQTASLSTLFHGVEGTAEIIDDCTIELRDFRYDGAGIDVQIYAARDGRYDGGFSISPDLVLPGGYDGETLTLTLPVGRDLDDLDGISVWCVAVGIDFGSGSFR